MLFAGIQKLTLLDFPDKTACTLFTAGCDFVCPYCQNASLISPADGTLNETEVLDFLASRRGLLDGVCISGGEPLLHDVLISFVGKVKEMGFLVKVDTNGSNPRKLKDLLESGNVDFISMDIKNSPAKYAQTIDMPGFDVSLVDESLNLLIGSAASRDDAVSYEFRTTVVKEFHTFDDLLSISRWISGACTRALSDPSKYFLQKFMDSDGVKQKGLHGYSNEEMLQFIDAIKTVLPSAELRGV